jgi:Lrp/AsnC family transcriptional regulator
MDETDLRILRTLQDDASLSASDIARRVGLSASPCWKRINRLRKEGIIRRQTAILDGERLGFGLTVFVNIKTGEHSSKWLKIFADTVRAMPEVLEFHRMAGDVDYMLKVVVADIKAFDTFYKHLIEATGLTEVTSRIAMEAIKETTELPI